MTNKPMLSVERDLIQRIADHCKFWIDHPYLEAIADVEVKLRTLLDKPSVEPEPYGWVQTAGKCINQITQEWDVVEGWTEKGYLWKALYTESPAQHQGEVAQLHEEIERLLIRGQNCSNKVATLRAQLAEQPAPVAVVMPELDFSFEHWWKTSGQYCRAGGGDYEKTFGYRAYEAALAEVARLNGVKP